MDFNEILTIYKYIKNNKHDIVKINDKIKIITNHITFICNYILIFIVDDNDVLWTCDNCFMDNNSKLVSKYIKDNIEIASPTNFIDISKKINKLIKKGINIDTNVLFLCSNVINNISYYYIITDIVNIF